MVTNKMFAFNCLLNSGSSSSAIENSYLKHTWKHNVVLLLSLFYFESTHDSNRLDWVDPPVWSWSLCLSEWTHQDGLTSVWPQADRWRLYMDELLSGVNTVNIFIIHYSVKNVFWPSLSDSRIQTALMLSAGKLRGKCESNQLNQTSPSDSKSDLKHLG